MDLLISLVIIQEFVSLCSGLRCFKECDGDRKEMSIPLPDLDPDPDPDRKEMSIPLPDPTGNIFQK